MGNQTPNRGASGEAIVELRAAFEAAIVILRTHPSIDWRMAYEVRRQWLDANGPKGPEFPYRFLVPVSGDMRGNYDFEIVGRTVLRLGVAWHRCGLASAIRPISNNHEDESAGDLLRLASNPEATVSSVTRALMDDLGALGANASELLALALERIRASLTFGKSAGLHVIKSPLMISAPSTVPEVELIDDGTVRISFLGETVLLEGRFAQLFRLAYDCAPNEVPWDDVHRARMAHTGEASVNTGSLRKTAHELAKKLPKAAVGYWGYGADGIVWHGDRTIT